MRYLYIVILIGLFNTPILYADVPRIITGKITDTKTNQPISNATIFIHELRVSTISDIKGEFNIKDIPLAGRYTVEISSLGYETYIQMVNFNEIGDFHVGLQPTSQQMKEVIITGTGINSSNKRSSTSATALNRTDLLIASTNIIDAISKQAPGVSAITTGPSISKPVIRGLSSNRVVTIGDGIKQQGNQWGDEHGIEIDQFAVDRVEVLRGAASLMYGSDALGGVINMLEPLAPAEGQIEGDFATNYSTNSGLIANSLMLTGNQSGLVWRARGTYKNAYSFKTPSGYFPNSGFNETSLSGMLGLNKNWGYSHLNFSYFKNNIGFYSPEFNNAGDFIDMDGSLFSEDDFKNRKLVFPRQDIRHYKLAWNSNIVNSDGYFKINVGYQRNQRREMDNPSPSLFLDLETLSADLKYYMTNKDSWQPVFGLSTEAANSTNKGSDFLLPDYTTFGIGGFAYVKKSWDKTTLNGGLRYDFRQNKGDSYIKDGEEFDNYTNSFSNLSGALGLTYELNDNLNFKANTGTAFRSPNPPELSSNGVHEGTFRYEIGNTSLKPERSYQADISLEYQNGLIEGSLGVYVNQVDDYIYISSKPGEEINGMAIYRYGQVNAFLKGFEGYLNVYPLKNKSLHLDNTFAYTHAQNKTLDKPLPFMPAGSLKNTLKYEPNVKNLKQSYISIGLDNFFKQSRIDETFETVTSGYSLLNAAVGSTIIIGKQPVSLFISGSNLLNKRYYDALSRLKPGRLDHNNPNIGIYNIGRNITFGLTLPIL